MYTCCVSSRRFGLSISASEKSHRYNVSDLVCKSLNPKYHNTRCGVFNIPFPCIPFQQLPSAVYSMLLAENEMLYFVKSVGLSNLALSHVLVIVQVIMLKCVKWLIEVGSCLITSRQKHTNCTQSRPSVH